MRFTRITSFHPHDNPMTLVLLSFDRRGSRHGEAQGHRASSQWNWNLNADLPADSKALRLSALQSGQRLRRPRVPQPQLQRKDHVQRGKEGSRSHSKSMAECRPELRPLVQPGSLPSTKVRDHPLRGETETTESESRAARCKAPDLRLSKRHREQGVRPPLGEQGQSLNELLLQLVEACRLRLQPGETVELGISILEGPVVFHWGAEAQAWGRRGN